jgi:hypothetical protein
MKNGLIDLKGATYDVDGVLDGLAIVGKTKH